MIAADGQNMDPALLEMGHALIPGRGREGATTRDCLPAHPSVAALLGAK